MSCDDLGDLKTVVRCCIVATFEPMTVDELWQKVINVYCGPHHVNLDLFGYDSVYDFLKSIPDVCQLEEPENENSIVNLVSSDLSKHMEELVLTNIQRPRLDKTHLKNHELLVPYQIQCAFIRTFLELYPKGLSIDDFISDVLCFPIFKQYIDRAEVIISNLDHIFKRRGSDMISLQPAVLNRLKVIKEEGKFTVREIKNIDEHALQDLKADHLIANGLEYKLFYLLEEPIKNNIELLLNENRIWIDETSIHNLYIDKFGSTFAHCRRWGFKRVSQMFSKLPEICCVHFSENKVEIISVKDHICDKKTNLDKEICDFKISTRDKTEEKPYQLDVKLKTFLENDAFLKTNINDCFLDQEIPNIEFKVNQSFDVKVCRVNMNIIKPNIVCQILDKSDELKSLLADMNRFYFLNDEQFMFDPSLILVKQTYAFCFEDSWFRGIVTEIDLFNIKMFNIDTGHLNTLSFDDIRILHKQFSKLPSQAFTCHLHDIKGLNEDELSVIVERECTIFVTEIEKITKTPSVKIKMKNSDKWIGNEPDDLDE